ncbi:XylR N-terminal domain-containing protein [Bacillus sp. OK048]|uniref:XylR N-terminal domain-containing protein n=1 Tax=Bacillus sp. OK048 TaxID=1882761 RepID=UPI00088ADBBF|nr:XylR N-terminal domain-containing protein [Bacillus sp. OK048]SDN34244.1 V4R domain-containing protein [Bacillus sp. OK048]
MANQFLSLNEQLHISKIDDLLYVNNNRSVLIQTSAFGILQRDLINNIGINRMKAFFFKYGWQLGEEDAQDIIMDQSLTLLEKILKGPYYHTAKGHVRARVSSHDLEMENGKVKTLRIKWVWEDSNEAEQHIRNFGLSTTPVCYTLTGYASGYVSRLVGEEVFFKEHQCVGAGDHCCIWEGRLLSEWKEDADELLLYSKELPILKELEQANEKLLIEKNNLAMVTAIHKELTDEIIKGNTIGSILDIVNRRIEIPVIVEDVYFQEIDKKGISTENYEPIKKSFKVYLKNRNHRIDKVTVVPFEHGHRLVTPIFLEEKVIGYCSFLYMNKEIKTFEIDSMIIGRVSSICSVLIYNEKTKLKSMQRIKGDFLEEIVSGKYPSEQEIGKKAGYIQLNLSGDYHVVNLTYSYQEGCEEKALIDQISPYEGVAGFFTEKNINILISQRPDTLLLLIPENQLEGQSIEHILHSLVNYLKKKVKHVLFLAGLSAMSRNIAEAGAALVEAQSAVRLSTREEPITTFNDLGMIGVLINQQNENAVRKIITSTLGKLYENINRNKKELIETLYKFLVNGGNLELTAEHLALSVSGLRYRLNKIMDLLGRNDLRDPQVQFQMLLALKALKIIDKEY